MTALAKSLHPGSGPDEGRGREGKGHREKASRNDIWGWKSFVMSVFPVHCRRFNSNPDSYSLDTGSCAPVVRTKNVPQLYQMGPGGQNHLLLRINGLLGGYREM